MTGLFGKNNGFLPQFLAVLSATLNAVSDGMNYAWSSPMIPRLMKKDFTNLSIEITDTDETWLEMTLLISGLLGLPLTTYSVNKIGRKQSTLAACCACVIGWAMIAFANHVVYLYIARFIMGVAADISFISSPMYIAEISHKNFRGFLAGIVYIMSMSGTLIIYIIGTSCDFYLPSLVAGGFLVAQLATLPFMPDSPYFLILKDKVVEARKSLQRLRGNDEVDDEIMEIQGNIEAQGQQEKGRVSDLFTVPSIRKAVVIMAVLNGGQHLGGFTVITMNLHSILEAARSDYLSDYISAILFAALMLVASILALLVVDKFGRKIILILSSITTGLTLVTIAVYFTLQADGDVSSISWVPVVAVMVFAITFKLGLGIVPIVLTAELFPPSVKAYGMASADAMYVIFGSLSIYLYQFLKDDAGGIQTPFYLFASCCFFTGIFTFLFVPETKGKTLEEIQSIMKS